MFYYNTIQNVERASVQRERRAEEAQNAVLQSEDQNIEESKWLKAFTKINFHSSDALLSSMGRR